MILFDFCEQHPALATLLLCATVGFVLYWLRPRSDGDGWA